MQRSLQQVIAGATEIAALPATTWQLLDLLEDPDQRIEAVVAVIEIDPGLTANLLKLCNSAYYGARRQLGTVREALVHLGQNNLLVLAFATSMGRVMRRPLTAYRLRRGELWRHVLATALAATRLLPPSVPAGVRNRAFTVGLLHDVGKLVLDDHLCRQLVHVPENADFSALLAAERQAVGHDHAEVGAALAESWGLPGELVEPIRDHHAPTGDSPSDLTVTVAVANVLAGQLGYPAGAVREGPITEFAALVGLEPDGLAEITEAVRSDLRGLLALLGEKP